MRGEHRYGGDWTERKVAILRQYAEIYSRVMDGAANQGIRFHTWYFDAFAGSGDRVATVTGGGLLEGKPLEQQDERFDGSARQVLGIDPGFDHYRLVELDNALFKRLELLSGDFPHKDVKCHRGDGNKYLQKVFGAPPWTSNYKKDRALVFLDPYGMGVEWETLKCLANCQAADVWYFFNIAGLIRNIPHDASRIDHSKFLSVTAMFGTEEWRTRFYEAPRQGSMLDDLLSPSDQRAVDRNAVLQYAKERYGSIFDYVSDPIPLPVTRMGEPYVLFCMSNSNSKPAIAAIKRIVQSVKRLGHPASRQKSGRAKDAH